MKQNKLHYNTLLRLFNKCKRRLSNLMATGRNRNRQSVLQRHIERLYAKMMSLHASMQRGRVSVSLAIAAISFNSNDVQAQTFGAPQTNPFNLTSVNGDSAPTFTDLDNDGDLDMLGGDSYGNFNYFQNIGTSTVPNYSTVVANPFGLANVSDNDTRPVFLDMDNDGDMDILSGSNSGNFYYFQNIGTTSTPMYAAMSTNPFGLTIDYDSSPTFADLDNDGDLDMLSGSIYGNFNYYQNTGTVSVPAFAVIVANPYGLASAAGNSHPTFIDMDSDGDMDILSGYAYGDFSYYQNTGTASVPSFAAGITNPFFLSNLDYSVMPTFVDLDNNGDKELMCGGYSGSFKYYKKTIPGPATALNFDAFNDIVKISASPALNNFGLGAFTLEGWVNPNGGISFGTVKSIIRKTGDYNLYINNGYLTAEVWQLGMSDPNFTTIQASTLLNLNIWQHIAFVWNGTMGSLYVNGAIVASTSSVNSYLGAENLSLGASSLFGQSLDGSLDEVRIWNVARTTCQINDYKNCEIPSIASGLVANYHFNQGMSPAVNTSVTMLTDASGSAHTGTLTNVGLTGVTSNWTAPGGVVSGYTVTSGVNVAASNSAICMGNSTTLSVTGADTYTWSGSVINGAAFSPTSTASYTVVGTVTLTGCTNTVVSTVTVNALPIVFATTSNSLLCTGNSASLTATGAASYTWNTGATTSVIAVSPTTTVTYTVNGEDANGCANVATVTQSVSTCTGIDNLSSNISNSIFQLYPNPTSGILNIKLEMINEGNATIEITNALGQVVLASSPLESTGVKSFDIHHLKNGVYFVKVTTGNTQTIKRLVVSN